MSTHAAAIDSPDRLERRGDSTLAPPRGSTYCGAVKPSLRNATRARPPGTDPKDLPPALARDLRRLLGGAGFIAEPDRLLAYECDALTRIRGTPLAVALPGTRAELRETVRLLYEAGVAFVPRGAGTGLTGGAVARGAVLIGTARLDRILRLDPVERLAVVEPGVVTEEISRQAAPFGLRYLPDPGSATACTIGGNIATNAGGPHCLRHGVTSDHVLSLQAVLGDGSLVELDRADDGGLDIAGLFIGSEGTFGIVASATVRLAPCPEAVRTSLALFDRVADAGRAVTEILAAGALPVALEIIDGTTIRVVEGSPFAAGLPTDAGAALVIECEGSAGEADEEMSVALEAVRTAGPRELLSAATEAERERLWRARKSAFGALGRLGRDVLVEDAVVPRTTLPDLLPRIEAVAGRYGLPLASFFHAGDGNLHPNIVYDARSSDQSERVEAARLEILDLCIEAGGTITGEHGVGLDKLKSVPRVLSADELRILAAVRTAVDPHGLCNPGKVLPAPGPLNGTRRDRAERELATRPPKAGPSDAEADGWHAPSAAAAAAELLAGRSPGREVMATGAPAPPEHGPDTGDALLLSTSRWRGVEHRRDDLTVTVAAGERVADLITELDRERQWIPVGPAALRLSIGGLVAAAPPGPFDAAFGPLRRQLLGLRCIGLNGVLQRWGRPVMKNVAGYDVPRLYCGSFGRLGLITEATFRVWPLPKMHLRLSVSGGDTLQLARHLADGEDAQSRAVRPDGMRWDLEPLTGAGAEPVREDGKLTLWLLGSERSVAARHARLADLAEESGLRVESGPGMWITRPEPPVGEAAGVAFRIRPSRTSLWELPLRLSRVLACPSTHVSLLPGPGVLELRHACEPSDARSLLERILGVVGEAPVTIERGGAEAHSLLQERRPSALRRLEDRIVSSIGGQPRPWQADYL